MAYFIAHQEEIMNNEIGRWRVWQWGVHAHLGSHGQLKASTSTVARGFDSKEEAQAWVDSQTEEVKAAWRNWAIDKMGGNVVIECLYKDIPQSFKAACEMASTMNTPQN